MIVNEKNEILSGHLRVFAARLAKIETISAETQSFESKEDELEFLIDMNVGRVKTSEQKAREYQARFEIEKERADKVKLSKLKQYGKGSLKTDVGNFPQRTHGKSRDKAAKKVGWDGSQAQRASKVVTAIDNLKETGQNKQAEELRKTLNDGSVNRAYQDDLWLFEL